MKIRDAVLDDAEEMSKLLKELTASGKRKSPDSETFVRAHYIEDPRKIRCSVAEKNGVMLGFQSLTLANIGNKYGVEPGWGIIGTHIRPSAARQGVGRALFAISLDAAKSAAIERIEASIANDNPAALSYYEAMGFRTYRTPQDLTCKCLDLKAYSDRTPVPVFRKRT